MDLLILILQGVIVAATPLVFAAIGELVVERAGVLNLGIEGMMILGAIAGFSVTLDSGSYLAGIIAAAAAGAVAAFLFGVLTQVLMANQVATGLALTIFGLGLSALWGQGYSGESTVPLAKIHIPLLSDIPIIGPLLFSHDPLVYLSILLVAGVAWFLTRTRAGMILRAVGENPEAVDTAGISVFRMRYQALIITGVLCGIAGAYLSTAQNALFIRNMTAGQGFIALAALIFGKWRPVPTVLACFQLP